MDNHFERFAERPERDEMKEYWAHQDEHDRDDGLNAARGIVFGIIVGFVFWAVIAAAVWIGWSRAEARPAACTNFPHECAAAVTEWRL